MTTWGLRWAASSAWQVPRQVPGKTDQGRLSGSAGATAAQQDLLVDVAGVFSGGACGKAVSHAVSRGGEKQGLGRIGRTTRVKQGKIILLKN